MQIALFTLQERPCYVKMRKMRQFVSGKGFRIANRFHGVFGIFISTDTVRILLRQYCTTDNGLAPRCFFL